jgi:hypothetical protein
VSADHTKHKGAQPVYFALAIAITGIVAMLLVDHGPWTRPHPQNAQVAQHMTTGEAARSAGAVVVPTAPKSTLEPEPIGPKRAEPPNPEPE